MSKKTGLRLLEAKVLEKIFEAEIAGKLPKQMKSSIRLQRMAAANLIEQVEATVSGIHVTGWELTHYGRRTYCQWATDNHKIRPNEHEDDIDNTQVKSKVDYSCCQRCGKKLHDCKCYEGQTGYGGWGHDE